MLTETPGAAVNTRVTSPSELLKRTDEELLRECEVDTFRASGPGGQKRNKTDSAVRLRHQPTGLVAQAVESRSQHENRARALARLRHEVALSLRTPVALEGYRAPPELRAILPGNTSQRIGPKHRDFWLGVRELLDVFAASGCSVGDTARVLGLSTGALSRLLTSEPQLHARVNRLREEKALRPLR
jgi:hypothetical protein